MDVAKKALFNILSSSSFAHLMCYTHSFRWGQTPLCLALKYDWGDKAISWLLSLGADISDIPANEATAYLDRWNRPIVETVKKRFF